MRRSELQQISEVVHDRIGFNELNGHENRSTYKAADGWDSMNERTRDRIRTMLSFAQRLVPFMLPKDLAYLVGMDEGLTVTPAQMANMSKAEIGQQILENAKSDAILDCVRGWSIRIWLDRRKWEKVIKRGVKHT